jgi:hypothetical protein
MGVHTAQRAAMAAITRMIVCGDSVGLSDAQRAAVCEAVGASGLCPDMFLALACKQANSLSMGCPGGPKRSLPMMCGVLTQLARRAAASSERQPMAAAQAPVPVQRASDVTLIKQMLLSAASCADVPKIGPLLQLLVEHQQPVRLHETQRAAMAVIAKMVLIEDNDVLVGRSLPDPQRAEVCSMVMDSGLCPTEFLNMARAQAAQSLTKFRSRLQPQPLTYTVAVLESASAAGAP